MLKLNSFILPDPVIEKMKNQLDISKKTGKELGFILCANKYNKIIVDRQHCEGTTCKIRIPRGCKENENDIGNYHTHPDGSSSLSSRDLIGSCLQDVACVSGTLDYKIRCFVRKKVQSEEENITNMLDCSNKAEKYRDSEELLTRKIHGLEFEGKILKNLATQYEAGRSTFSAKQLEEQFGDYKERLDKLKEQQVDYIKGLHNMVSEYFNTTEIIM